MKLCRNILSNGACTTPFCRFDHTVLACEPCGYIAERPYLYQNHLKSKEHLVTVTGENQTFFCSICDINVNGGDWKVHCTSLQHRTSATAKRVSLNVEPEHGVSTDSETYCPVCRFTVKTWFWNRHSNGEDRQRKERFLQFRAALDEAEKDKNAITVEGVTDFGFVAPKTAKQGLLCDLIMKSSEPSGRSVLIEARLASQKATRPYGSGFSLEAVAYNEPISSAEPRSLTYGFEQKYIGRYEDRLELVFEDTQLKKRFVISRLLRAIVGNQAEHEALRPIAPYVPRKRTTRTPESQVVPGVPPPSSTAVPYVSKLPFADIPVNLYNLLTDSRSQMKKLADIKKLYLPGLFLSQTYARQFENLLWIEEHQTEADLERYDMTGARLSKWNQYYYLAIPGLAEKRPSVLVGDRILVQVQSERSGRWFEGHVHVLRQNEVGLRFHTTFTGWSESKLYDIRFKLNRIVLRRQHQALDSAFEEDRVLFPEARHAGAIEYTWKIAPYNPLIASNECQMDAVKSIVHQGPGGVPFIVFGPPGTGKTITIVEAIRQLLKMKPNCRILACAPSNSAADIIAERLTVGLTANELFRMYAPSRSKADIPDKLRDYVHSSPDGHFSVPSMGRLKNFRVVVATCVSAAISTNIVLSGDPKQLGPIVRSGIARRLGLEMSYLERLMGRDIYDVKKAHGKTVVKLTKNFRSHAAILKFPNERFYAGDLDQCAKPSVINACLSSPFLPDTDFPVVFHAVLGKDDREASSPSFFNIDEALQIKSYIRQLKENRKFRTTDRDIGVIAPYHAQCLKLRTALRSVADGVKVGSVEEFQGQGRKVILTSTVRSSKDFVDYDLRHTLGFVANPRRFNVSVTRAQSLLIIVGNPHVLGLDPLWRSFLNYIHLKGGWVGPDIPWDSSEAVDAQGAYDKSVRDQAHVDVNEFTRRMEELTLGQADEENDANVDRPWRDVE
ncbi:hypothetical protein EST38_g3643 [Candolleomyces aberdarensis]|uniref:RNA helicase n=1 Tax=Candolleomyces aberdarensis TaxID=2316362 RepID=A0A4Q2DRK1_9AGAR|nr:hypothetical protein EST38_g3643 [Candolleomyces aberdarensis]